MAKPNVSIPSVYTTAPFGGPKAQGAHVPNVPKIVKPKGTPPTKDSHAYSRQIAEQAALKAGVDPKELIRQLSYVSGLNPTARASGYGIAGLGPGAMKNTNPWDPQASMDYVAKVMAGLQLLKARR